MGVYEAARIEWMGSVRTQVLRISYSMQSNKCDKLGAC